MGRLDQRSPNRLPEGPRLGCVVAKEQPANLGVAAVRTQDQVVGLGEPSLNPTSTWPRVLEGIGRPCDPEAPSGLAAVSERIR